MTATPSSWSVWSRWWSSRVLYWFFGTELGCAIRATGSNPAMSRAQGINTNFNKVLGLVRLQRHWWPCPARC